MRIIEGSRGWMSPGPKCWEGSSSPSDSTKSAPMRHVIAALCRRVEVHYTLQDVCIGSIEDIQPQRRQYRPICASVADQMTSAN